MWRLSLAITVVLVALAAGYAAAPANASFPGRNGLIAYYRPDPAANLGEIEFILPDGRTPGGDYSLPEGYTPAFSADGRHLAYGSPFPGHGIRLNTVLPRGEGRPLTRPGSAHVDAYPSWSPDGKRIVFERSRVVFEPDKVVWTDRAVYTVRRNGRGVRRLAAGGAPNWSAHGRIAFERVNMSGDRDIYVVNARGRGVRAVTGGPRDDSNPSWSPDGSRIVFARALNAATLPDLGGTDNLFSVGARSGPVRQVTRGPAHDGEPAFSPDGRKLVFVRNDGLYVVPATGGAARSLHCSDCFSPDWQPLPR